MKLQRFNTVKLHKKIKIKDNNHIFFSLANEITAIIHIINNSEVNFIEKQNHDKIQISKKIFGEKSFLSSKKYLNKGYKATILKKNNHSSNFISFVV